LRDTVNYAVLFSVALVKARDGVFDTRSRYMGNTGQTDHHTSSAQRASVQSFGITSKADAARRHVPDGRFTINCWIHRLSAPTDAADQRLSSAETGIDEPGPFRRWTGTHVKTLAQF
jgi:hypothetical protein